jgi:hypothetical protein
LEPKPTLSLSPAELGPVKMSYGKVYVGRLWFISQYLNANIHGGILGPVEQIV